MKKILAIALALLMVFALVACGGGNTNDSSESENPAASQTSAATEKTDPAGEQTADSAEHPVLKLCGLTVEDVKAGVGTSLGENFVETESQFVCSVFSSENSFANFESWVNAFAENCRKASKDGKLYESETSTEEVVSFSLDPNALMNTVQFIYWTSNNKVIYVTVMHSVTGSAFSCSLQVYDPIN